MLYYAKKQEETHMPSLANMRTQAKEAGLMKLDKLIAKRQHSPTNDFPSASVRRS